MQAKLLAHSELLMHSGRQFGGVPLYSGKHEQEGASLTTLHCAFGPQGEGLHGFKGIDGGSSSEKETNNKFYLHDIEELYYLWVNIL